MNERIIIGIKRGAKINTSLGLVAAIAEEVDGKLSPITMENFCPTREVFITNGYEEIEENFREYELFKIRVEFNQTQSGPCTYKASGHAAQRIQPNEIAEIIHAELPDRNHRRLNIRTLPITKYILIQNNSGDCYGPFNWEDKSQLQDDIEIELKIINSGGLGKMGGEKRQICKISANKINSNAIECESLVGKKYLAQDIYKVTSGSSLEEYANDKEIIEEIKKIAGDPGIIGRTIDRKNLETLSNFAGKNKHADYPLNKSRIALFNKIVSSNSDILGEINEWFEAYLKSPSGAKIIEDYIQKNREKYIDRLKADKEIEINENIKTRQDELDRIKKVIEDFLRERTRLSDEIETKRKDLEKNVITNQKTYLEKISKESHEKIVEINAKESAAESRLAIIEARIGKLAEVDDIQKLVIAKQAVLDHIQQQVEEKKKDRDAVLEESRRAEDDIRKKLRGMKPYVDHLNGSFTGEEFKQIDIKVGCINFSYKEEILAQRSIIKSVKIRLAGLGRSMDDHEIANLLISTQQCFITFFAGLPGVGKTSLCKLLTQAQGIEKRLLSISVARGWTSVKDMVGFHNPLNDRFQPASTGMYEFLQAIDAEVKSEDLNPMAYILLDEANLSSIEHYWSAFMGITDATTNQNLAIGQKPLIIPRNLRFLATINYDGTTEPLSPRILDRAGVVVMRPGDITPHQSVDESALQALPICSENMNTLFGLFNETPELESREKSAFEAITEILCNSTGDKGRSIHISQRKINAIRQYCGRARPIMRSDGKELTALDFAIMQHVLPQVTGHGIKFGNRLTALKKCFEDHDLEKSAGYLEKMISSGQNDLHSYEFFCW